MKLFMFVMFAALLLVGLNSASAQIPQAIPFAVEVTATPLEITPTGLSLTGLQTGTTYTAIPDGAGSLALTPGDPAAVDAAGQADIVGDFNSQILVSFVLPTRLFPTGGTGAGFVNCRFNNTSAAWGPGGAEVNYFDPRNPTSITLGGDGAITIILGGIFEVPGTAGPDVYEGEALVTAQYTGLN